MDFEDYVHACGQSLVRFAYVLCSDPHMAEDLVQSALAKAYRRWRRVAVTDHPDAYVQRIIVNTYLSARRRRWTSELPASDPLLAGARPGTAVAPDVAAPNAPRTSRSVPSRRRSSCQTIRLLSYAKARTAPTDGPTSTNCQTGTGSRSSPISSRAKAGR